MGLWQRLLSVDTPGDASLKAVDASVRGVGPVVLTLGIVAVAGLVVTWFYRLEPARLDRKRRVTLVVLRILALALLCVMVFRPVQFAAVFKGDRPRAVVVLLDNSESMKHKDRRVGAADRQRVRIAGNWVPLTTPVTGSVEGLPTGPADPSRIELVRAVLTHPGLELYDKLAKVGPVKTYLFGSRVRRLVGEGPSEKQAEQFSAALTADETSTALADAVAEVLLKGDGDLPAAIVVLTDGGENASKQSLADAARECARLGVPLHVYGVGSTEGGTLEWRDVTVPDVLFTEDTVSVPVRWRAAGITRGVVEITLKLGDKEVARREVVASAGDDLRETLTFTPDKGLTRTDKLDLTATIRVKGSPIVSDEIKRPVRVVERKIKVLYIEGQPRWEYKFLQRALLRDRRVEARFLLAEADAETLKAGPPYLAAFPATRKDLFAFDLVILGDVPAGFLGTERIAWLRDFVSEGGGLVQIAGPLHAPASYVGTGLAELLPVEFQAVRFRGLTEARPQAFNPMLTPAGERHPVLALADSYEENLKVWRELPGMYWYYPATRVRPGATVLLAHPTDKLGDEPMPLLTTHYYGKGIVFYSAFDETWRWRFNTQEKYFARYWGQVVYYAGLPRTGGTRQTQLALDRTEIQQGRPGQVFVRLFDENFKPLVRKSVTARLEQLDVSAGNRREQIIELLPVEGQEGEYRAVLPHDRAGRFVLTTDTPDPASLEYRVGLPPQHELTVRGMAEEPLREAARLSGGAFYREEDLHRLPGQVKPQHAAFEQRQQVLPWNPLAFLLLVGLITMEWVVRKFANLS
jgi:uncharacterized membrane protein